VHVIRFTATGEAMVWWQSQAMPLYKWELRLSDYLAATKVMSSLEAFKTTVCNMADMAPLTEADRAELYTGKAAAKIQPPAILSGPQLIPGGISATASACSAK
jgi:hypothetical protein